MVHGKFELIENGIGEELVITQPTVSRAIGTTLGLNVELVDEWNRFPSTENKVMTKKIKKYGFLILDTLSTF